MSAQVDVLAVMDALIALMHQGQIGIRGAHEARASVATLIAERDALREALAAVLNYCVDDEGQPTIATARAALAITTGESA